MINADLGGLNSAIITKFATSDLYDAARRLGLEIALEPLISIEPGLRVASPAYTIKFSAKKGSDAPSLNFYDVIANAPKGHALVVEAGADVWLLGANISRYAELSGMTGLIIDGCIRDIAVVRKRGYPIFSRGASPVGYSSTLALTAAGDAIDCAGVTVATGDIVVADDDGVISIPAERLQEILYEAAEIVELDAKLGGDIEARRPLSELHDTRLRWSARRAATE